MSKYQPPTYAYLAGLCACVLSVLLGYAIRGGDVANNARLHELVLMGDSLSEIAAKLPPKEIVEVEVEKIVQAPFCEELQAAFIDWQSRDPKPETTANDICRELMRFSSSYSDAKNTYEAINEWIETSSAPAGGIEDEIMSQVVSTLILCFRTT